MNGLFLAWQPGDATSSPLPVIQAATVAANEPGPSRISFVGAAGRSLHPLRSWGGRAVVPHAGPAVAPRKRRRLFARPSGRQALAAQFIVQVVQLFLIRFDLFLR